MTTKNKRSIPTTFSFKDVVVVVTAMLTALAPLFTNDYKINQLEQQSNVLIKEVTTAKLDLENIRTHLTILSDSVNQHHNGDVTEHDVIVANQLVEVKQQVDLLSQRLEEVQQGTKSEIIIRRE